MSYVETIREQDTPSVNKWIIALTVILPTFIEVMDTSVVNVSLPHIQGGLNAGLDESTWVLTSYLVSNAVIIPITGFLSNILGRKRYLIGSIILFTFASMLCGSAPSLEILVLARILQGIGGGALQPISQSILLESFPKKEHGMAMAIFGMGVVLAPTIGPVVGGWITDNLSWRWVFYINLPIGILSVFMTILFIFDPPYIKQRKKGKVNYFSLILLFLWVGCLQIVLDKGQREDWFESNFIITLTIIFLISFLLYIVQELYGEDPILDISVFKDKVFLAGNFILFTGFMSFFGSIVLLPLFLQNLMNYTAMWAGLVLGPSGLATMIVIFIVGRLLNRGVPPYIILMLGLSLISLSVILMGRFTLNAGFWELCWPRVMQSCGMGMFFVPLTAATYVNIPKEKIGNASSIFNLLRNLGGSFGTAIATTYLARSEQFNQTLLVKKVVPYRQEFWTLWHKVVAFLHYPVQFPIPDSKPLALIYMEVRRQAGMLAFNDTFIFLGTITMFLIPIALILRKK
ncbi:MDR family MFS transporter [Desulfothermus naphthae]